MELNKTRLALLEYTNLLAEISHVPPLIPELEYVRKAASPVLPHTCFFEASEDGCRSLRK